MKNKVYLWGAMFLVLAILFFSAGFMIKGSSEEVQEIQPTYVQVTETIPAIEGSLDVWLIRDGEVIQESHGPIYIDEVEKPTLMKVFYNDGLESIETWAADGVNQGPFTNISLCNVSVSGFGCASPIGAGTEAFTSFNNLTYYDTNCGLNSTAGTVFDKGVGNVTLSHTFTILTGCANIDLNVTRITNSTGGLWLGKALDTAITNAQPNDQVTINASWWGVST